MSFAAIEAERSRQRWLDRGRHGGTSSSRGDCGWANDEKEAWKPIHDVVVALRAISRRNSATPIDVAAAEAVANFFGSMLEDFTRAVPWDDGDGRAGSRLKDARQRAVDMAWDMLLALAHSADGGDLDPKFFAGFGEMICKYKSLIDTVNQEDAEHLLKLRLEAISNG